MTIFTITMRAGWGDMDFNGHMRNTAYLDKSSDVRMMFFAQNGFPMAEFARLRIGPVVMKDEIEYFREVNLLDEITIHLELAGLAADGSRFKLRNAFYRMDGKMSARITSIGGWLDLTQRKLVIPPNDLLAVQSHLTRSNDFEVLPSSIK